jgi:hypothetical protein
LGLAATASFSGLKPSARSADSPPFEQSSTETGYWVAARTG